MIRRSSLIYLGLGAASFGLLTGCAREISSNVYKASHVGEASFSYQGVIVSARTVEVTEGERLEENTTGIGLGALAGGLAGSTMGGGTGRVGMAGLGAVVGGVAGAFAEKALKKQQGIEYVVKLSNGQIMTVVQGLDHPMNPGQRVIVTVSHDGRSRVIPDNSGVYDTQPLAPQPNITKLR